MSVGPCFYFCHGKKWYKLIELTKIHRHFSIKRQKEVFFLQDHITSMTSMNTWLLNRTHTYIQMNKCNIWGKGSTYFSCWVILQLQKLLWLTGLFYTLSGCREIWRPNISSGANIGCIYMYLYFFTPCRFKHHFGHVHACLV